MRRIVIRTFKKYIFPLLCLVFLSLYLLSIKKNSALNSQLEQFNAQLLEVQNSLEKSFEKQGYYIEKSKADELFINQQYDSAMRLYSQLSIDGEINSIISERERVMQEMIQLETEFENYEALREELLFSIDSLYNSIDNWEDRYVADKITQLRKYDELEQKYESIQFNYEEVQAKFSEIKKNRNIFSFKNLNGNTVHYIGDLSNNLADGYGIGIWETGGVYKGEWKNNMRHGKGRYEWADGEWYEGDYMNDQRHGFGIYYFKNGEKYHGEWKANKRHGKGKIFNRNEELLYEGYWENDSYTSKSS
ncbi:MAG: hypothetical protein ACFCUU_11290 [Cyclobacteriaceae bacterium]